MRLVGTLQSENDAKRVCNYLKTLNIANNCEVGFDPQTGSMSYQLWIHDEDRLEEAERILTEYCQNPTEEKFNVPEPEPEPVPVNEKSNEPPPPPKRFKTYLTYLLIGLCSALFLLNTAEKYQLSKDALKGAFLPTRLQADLMYDLPPNFEQIEKIMEEHSPENPLPENQIRQVLKASDQPYWKGLYSWLVNYFKGTPNSDGEGPLFIKIGQGEVWRLITPCLLHQDLLHILFNMLWLWYLGRPVEERIGPVRTLILTLLVGATSNTIQYLASGPFFIGYSGIITGLAGFIWMRERIAPWEGYPLNKGTILFLLLFVLAILGIQMVAFFFQIFNVYDFAPNIANTAHISGAIIGAVLARFRFFAQRVHS